jgi:hypothetical protein
MHPPMPAPDQDGDAKEGVVSLRVPMRSRLSAIAKALRQLQNCKPNGAQVGTRR